VTPTPDEPEKSDPEPVVTGIKHLIALNDCPIQMVTVYESRAEVTRQLTFSTDTIGIQEIVVDGFVPQVMEDSFRISGGIGDTTILEVSHETVQKEEKDASDSQIKAKQLQDKITNLKYKLDGLNNVLEVLETEENWINEFGNSLLSNQTKVVNSVSPDELSNVMEFTSTNLQRIDSEKFTLKTSIKEITEQIEKTQKLCNENNTPIFTTKSQVTISLDVKSPKKIVLSLSYIIYGASWTSRYDVRVNSTKKSCVLNYLGVISNSTGEDWMNVNLHLSTASPALGGAPPKLYPLKLDFAVYRAKSKLSRKRSRRLSISMPVKDKPFELFDGKLSDVQQLDSKVRSGSTSVTYEIRRLVKIASDSKPHKVPITEILFPLEFQYIVLPSKGAQAYLKAKAINNTDFQLLEGEMNVFIDEFFITTSKLQQTVPGDKINMYLGIDAGVKVNIKPVHKQESTSGIIFTAKKTTPNC